MITTNQFWFHCGRCGSLFLSAPGDIENRLCSKCGFDPSLGITEPTAPVPQEELPKATENPAKRSVRRRKNSHLMTKLVCAWLVILAIIIAGARYLWPEQKAEQQSAEPKLLKESSNEEQVIYEAAWKQCAASLSGFLASGTPETRNQFVLQPVATASRMARFYASNPIVNIDPSKLVFTEHDVIDTPGGKILESVWTVGDNRKLDAVFREENGEWKLDWNHFIRYSDHPWPLFLAGTGEEQGEFRLLARERLAQERKNADSLSLVLYAPKFGSPGDTGYQSPEFLVSRNTIDGKLLDAAFDLTRRKGKVFGSTTSIIDPEGMIRVRVHIRRSEETGERRFTITKVLACHWYSLDDPGVEPAKKAGD